MFFYPACSFFLPVPFQTKLMSFLSTLCLFYPKPLSRTVSGVGYVLFCLFSGDDPVMVALKCLFFPLIHKKKKGKTHFGITSSLRSHPFCIAVLSIAGYK